MGDLFAQKQKNTSLDYYLKSISIYEELYGAESIQSIVVYNNIAGLYMNSNET